MRAWHVLLFLALAAPAEELPKKKAFEDFLVAPLRIHLLQTPGELNLTTTLTEKDIDRILGKVNRIWAQAGIHFSLERLVREPAALPEAYRQNYRKRSLRWLLSLRQNKTLAPERFHVFYIKRLGVNGVYLGRDGMFVKDTARLRTVKGGLDEPIPRVTAHELGHALTLRHRQNVTNLMASGTSGWSLNAAEIKQSRDALRRHLWVQPAPAILRRADAHFKAGNHIKARAEYRELVRIPLDIPEIRRARERFQGKK